MLLSLTGQQVMCCEGRTCENLWPKWVVLLGCIHCRHIKETWLIRYLPYCVVLKGVLEKLSYRTYNFLIFSS
jgi:hypothetical protein